jgi:hypothetical protein
MIALTDQDSSKSVSEALISAGAKSAIITTIGHE